MRIRNISAGLLFYIALVEGISLLIQQILNNVFYIESELFNTIFYGLVTGFFGLFIIILIYNLLPYKIKIADKEIKSVKPLAPSLFNAFFLAFAFLIQIVIEKLELFGLVGFALFGFVSIMLGALASILIYNSTNNKIKFLIDKKEKIIKKIPLKFAVIAGFFEAFIIPLMFVFYSYDVAPFLNGFFAGLIGSFIPFMILNLILKKKSIML